MVEQLELRLRCHEGVDRMVRGLLDRRRVAETVLRRGNPEGLVITTRRLPPDLALHDVLSAYVSVQARTNWDAYRDPISP
jgi:hypothetical protein